MAEEKKTEAKLSPKDSFKTDLYFWLQALVMALVTLILLFTFVGRVITVEGQSMEPTLFNADMLLLQSVGYEPQQGDVVVLTKPFSYVTGPIVKRVIATGGQTVHIDYTAGCVYVDGVKLDEPYIKEPMVRPHDPDMGNEDMVVPEGCIYVMGDNRNDSSDSRHVELGTVDERQVLGKVHFVLLPFGHFGAVE